MESVLKNQEILAGVEALTQAVHAVEVTEYFLNLKHDN